VTAEPGQGPVLGIDLGTTNSVVAIADGQSSRVVSDPEGNRLIPSCVSFHPDGQVLVGHAARERRLIDAENTVYSIKRMIGRPFTSIEVQRAKERFPFALEPSKSGGVQVRVRRGTYALPEISAMVLRHLRKVAEAALGLECKRAVITVPANFNELQRSATQAAGKVAGLEIMRILNEPTAATLAYGYGKAKPECIAVYDLGGGTFDFTLLDLDGDVFEVVSTAGDTFLGGDDIDLSIAERMAEVCLEQHRFDARVEPQSFERMRAAGEWAKCQLSGVSEAELTLEELFVGRDGRSVDFTFRMDRDELERRMRPLIARSFDVVSDALREAGRRPKEIDNVVLVGGSTRIPLVRGMVESFFGKPPRIDIDPDLVVAQGAAIHAWTLAGKPKGSMRPGDGGHGTLRKVSVAGLPPAKPSAPGAKEAPPRPREKLPKQPAFAPEEQRLADPFEAPSASAPRAPAAPSVAMIAAPVAIGSSGGSGLLDLDEPKGPERDGPVDDPFGAPGAGRARRDPTLPFHTGAKGAGTGAPAAPPVVRPPAVLPPSALAPAPPPPAPVAAALAKAAAAAAARTPGAAAGAAPPAQPPAPPAPPPIGRSSPTPSAARGGPPAQASVPTSATSSLAAIPTPPLAADADEFAFDMSEPFSLPEPSDADSSAPIDLELESLPPRPLAPAAPPPVAPPSPRAAPPPAPAPPAPAPPAPQPRSAPIELPPEPMLAAISAPSPAAARPAGPPPLVAGSSPATAAAAAAAAASAATVAAIIGAPPEPPPLAPRIAELALPSAPTPLLMDVTPLSLSVETAGGFCQTIVPRNAPVPTEKSRIFGTGRDDQTAVEVRICQGESTKFGENQALGTLVLDGLRKARRGAVRVEVTFLLDASGILDVRATDLDTQRVHATRIHLQGGIDSAEIDEMRQRQERELALS
jgi:molecular chaperone DnaK